MKHTFSLCDSCAAFQLVELNAEVCIHFRGLAGLNIDPILAYPKLRVCLYCGSIQSNLSAEELGRVRGGSARFEAV